MKVLVFDLETSPNLGMTWGKYQQDVLHFVEFNQIICMSWKWLDEKETYAMALPDYKGYKAGKVDDKKLVKDLWDLFDKADAVIAHNGDRFDIKIANARFAYHGLTPPSFYLSIDTKKIAKSAGMFPSNKLDDLGRYLVGDRKLETGGFGLWLSCMEGETKAWQKMKAYNKQDVILLEKVYKRLLPWAKNHPNRNVIDEHAMNCPRCGSDKVTARGFAYTTTGRKRRFKCKDCGSWSSGPHISSGVALR